MPPLSFYLRQKDMPEGDYYIYLPHDKWIKIINRALTYSILKYIRNPPFPGKVYIININIYIIYISYNNHSNRA